LPAATQIYLSIISPNAGVRDIATTTFRQIWWEISASGDRQKSKSQFR